MLTNGNLVTTIVPALIAAASGILGVAVAGWLSFRRDKRERQTRLLEQKLGEFYGPLLAIRSQIKAKSELREKISKLVNNELPKSLVDLPSMHPFAEAEYKTADQMVEYNNRQIEEDLLPAYKEMRDLFIGKMYLAEKSTLPYLSEIVNFIEIWDRWIDKSIPHTILGQLDHSENRLSPFYEDVQSCFSELQEKFSKF